MIIIRNITFCYSRSNPLQSLTYNKSFFGRQRDECVYALKNISLKAEYGDRVAIVGKNGSGKTTLIKLIAGIIRARSGLVNVLGYPPYKRNNNFLRKISFFTPNKNFLWWDLGARGTFYLNGTIFSINKKELEERIYDYAKMLNVEQLLDVPVMHLSYGQRTKLEIINSLLHNPELILLDEPTVGLDYESQTQIYKFLTEYVKTKKSILLLTSHHSQDILCICNKFALLDAGSIVATGDMNSLHQHLDKYKIMSKVIYQQYYA